MLQVLVLTQPRLRSIARVHAEADDPREVRVQRRLANQRLALLRDLRELLGLVLRALAWGDVGEIAFDVVDGRCFDVDDTRAHHATTLSLDVAR